MGVQHLWSILEQSKQVEPVEQLRDKTLCIDLSLWICEAQGTKGLKEQLKPYLRNVFFRTLYLVSIGVRPIFVIDGIPPEIKRETILKRLEARREQSGRRQNFSDKQRKLKRSKFTIWCNECCEMLKLLGIPFVKSDGEAEAMCAWLNVNKYADGVLTDDGDVFLYGARLVYKDFNISSSKLLADCLQVYNMKTIERDLGLNQRNMIALALLLGCDYLPSGVPGIGKETAIRLLKSLSGVDLLERFCEWKASPDVHPEYYTNLELTVKRKALKVANFPNKEVIKEFLSPGIGNKKISIKWTYPDLEGIKAFFFLKLEWPKEYTEEKILNLATDWQLAYSDPSLTPLFVPVRIVKQRIKQKIQHYEVEWKAQDVQGKWPTTFVSIKLKHVMLQKHSMMVESFENEIIAKKSKGKTKKKDLKVLPSSSSEGTDLLDNLLAKIDNVNLREIPTLPSEYGKTKKKEDLNDLPSSSSEGTDLLDNLLAKIDNLNLKEMPTLPLVCGKDCCEATRQTGENAKDIEITRKLSESLQIHDILITSNTLDEIPERVAHFIVPSLHNNVNLAQQHPGFRDTHQPSTRDLNENTTTIDLKQLQTLSVVSQNTKIVTCADIVDLSCCEEGEKLPNLKCSGSSRISPSKEDPAHLVKLEISNSLDSPAVNEKTMLNLVDITIDNSFESDLGNIEDLLASSFVAHLKLDMSLDNQPHSPRPEVNDCVSPRSSKDRSISQRSTDADYPNDEFFGSLGKTTLPSLNEFTLSNNYDERSDDADCDGSSNRRQATMDRKCVFISSTPQLMEESSLTSRLLKRFQGKDGAITNTLRLLSGGCDSKEDEYREKEMRKIGSSVLTTKPDKTYSRSRLGSGDSRPLNDITNQVKKPDIAFVVLE